MAKAKVVHSDDSCAIIFKGDKRNPEPSIAYIEFPGGCVEVSRTSDGRYWAHISVTDGSIVDSRLDYQFEAYKRHNGQIPPLPAHKDIQHLAIKVAK